jgi:thiamine-monophosphate kinase
MKLSELGEFALIDLIHSITDKFKNPRYASWQQLLVGIGDDAAAWQSNSHIQLATTDTLVQDIHFDLNLITWDELGWKALAVNLSDIAAMGGVPKYALVSLALPADLDVEDISKFTNSLARLAKEFGVAIAGGNMATSANIVITITIIGCSKDKAILRRSTASPGEQVAVTGYLGLSAAGLEMLQRKISLDAENSNILRHSHFQPMPRVKEGQILVEQGVKSAIDISDGLIADLDHICECSKVSARVNMEQVPVHPLVKANFPNYQQLALFGGEDYELLFTADKSTMAQCMQALNCPITIIGEITDERLPDRVTLVDDKGTILPHKKGGWEHFKNGTLKAKLA